MSSTNYVDGHCYVDLYYTVCLRGREKVVALLFSQHTLIYSICWYLPLIISFEYQNSSWFLVHWAENWNCICEIGKARWIKKTHTVDKKKKTLTYIDQAKQKPWNLPQPLPKDPINSNMAAIKLAPKTKAVICFFQSPVHAVSLLFFFNLPQQPIVEEPRAYLAMNEYVRIAWANSFQSGEVKIN